MIDSLSFETAKAIYSSSKNKDVLEVLETIFPQLRESDDEKIKEELIKHLRDGAEGYMPAGGSEDYTRWLTWVEKQSEQEPVPDWMPKFLDELRSMKHYFDWDEHKDIEGRILAIIDWMTPNYFNEKNGVQKPVIEMKSAEESLGISSEEYNDIVNECLYGESNSSDKEPKFNVGDWITNDDYTWKVIKVEQFDYILQSQNGNVVDDTISHVDEQFHLWTIKDAKDGDILASDNSIFIFQEEYIAEKPIAYCGLMNGCFIVEGEDICWTNEKCYPATQEQRDTLFTKMKEEGYEWDAEKKELIDTKPYGQRKECLDCQFNYSGECKGSCAMKRSEQKSQRMVSAEVKEALYDKLTDVIMDKDNIDDFAYQCAYDLSKDWLYENASWDDVQIACKLGAKWYEDHHKIQWSEEDEKMVKDIIAAIDTLYYHGMVNWLKSLKERIK